MKIPQFNFTPTSVLDQLRAWPTNELSIMIIGRVIFFEPASMVIARRFNVKSAWIYKCVKIWIKKDYYFFNIKFRIL